MGAPVCIMYKEINCISIWKLVSAKINVILLICKEKMWLLSALKKLTNHFYLSG